MPRKVLQARRPHRHPRVGEAKKLIERVPQSTISLPTVRAVAPTGCQRCGLREACGGLDNLEAAWGCMTQCGTHCATTNSECDYTCPRHMEDFVNRWWEVGGWPPKNMKQLPPQPMLDLPLYVPKIHHGHRRDIRLTMPMVAIPTFEVIGKRKDGSYGVRDQDAFRLKERFKVGENAGIMLVSVDYDQPLERYWRSRNASDEKVTIALERLGVIAMTVPNYSFFDDAPRPHTLWNRQRMIRAAEELSDAGITVIPHLNALTHFDWDFWRSFLMAQKGMHYISKEFQTGLSFKERAYPAIERLQKLQDEIGRELHPIVHGAAHFIDALAPAFKRFTIVDTVPFFMTMYRKVLVKESTGAYAKKQYLTPDGQPLDLLLEHNITEYAQKLEMATECVRKLKTSSRQTAFTDQRQLSLPFY